MSDILRLQKYEINESLFLKNKKNQSFVELRGSKSRKNTFRDRYRWCDFKNEDKKNPLCKFMQRGF